MTEVLTDDDRVLCEVCSSRAAAATTTDHKKSVVVSSAPYLLQIQFNRLLQNEKRVDRVTFPAILDTSLFVQAGAIYELYAVVLHIGGARGGHYIANIKVRSCLRVLCESR